MPLFDRIAKAFGYGNPNVGPMPLMVSAPQKVKPFQELGATGLNRTKGTGIVYEEWLAQLSTTQAMRTYRQMRDNDAVIGSMFFALEMILRRVEWRVEPKDESPKAADYEQFVTECMDDMSHTWSDFIAEIVNMFAFGFALFETPYKRRNGAQTTKPSSKFSDGKIGWRKMAPRAQETILYWDWDEEGGLQGAVQLAPPDYQTVSIPIEKLLLFRTTSIKNNPQGRSLLRNVFRAWFFKTRIEEVEGIGIERDLCGIPVLYATGDAITAMGGEENARKLVRNIRMDDQMGVVLPQAFDEKGNRAVELTLLKAAGSKQTKVSETIARHNADILSTMLAGFIQLGHTDHGSRSLHLSATQIFAEAIAAFMDSIAAIINRVAIPRLMALNSMDLELAPKLVPGEIGVRDLEEIGNTIAKLFTAGMTFNDKDTQATMRKLLKLPELPSDWVPGEALDDDLNPDGDAQPADENVPVDDAPPAQKPPKLYKPGKKPAQSAPASDQAVGDRLETAV